MLNIVLRATQLFGRSGSAVPTPLALAACNVNVLRLQNYASFTVRQILNETSDEAGTLLIRFAKHIAMESAKCGAPLVPRTIRYADYFPVTDVQYFRKELNRTPADQLPALITFAFTYRPSADPPKYTIVLNDLDAAALRQLPNMDEHTVLNTLYAFLFVIPNWIVQTDFYQAAMQRLVTKDFSGDKPKQLFVQLCYYLGLNKRRGATAQGSNAQHLQTLLATHLEHYLPQLSSLDLAIVCNAAYKTSTQVQSAAYAQRLEQEVAALPLNGSDDAVLVTLLKAMRFQRVRSTAICERLAALCEPKSAALAQLQARGLVHIFAYFAANLWDKSDCTQSLVDEFLRRLAGGKKFQSFVETVRAKDLATFLWCCAQLNCTIADADLLRIESLVLRKLRDDEFQYFPDQLVDCCLSLWTLGHRSRDLLEESVRMKTHAAQFKRERRELPKVDSRLTVLLAAAAIEQPTWTTKLMKPAAAFDDSTPAPAYLLKNRNDLTQYAKACAAEEAVTAAKLICPINGINIPSLLVQFGEPTACKVFVELLTDEQTLNFSSEPVALMRLKLRLLTALGHKVTVLRATDLQANYTNLKDLVFGDESDNDQSKEQSARSI